MLYDRLLKLGLIKPYSGSPTEIKHPPPLLAVRHFRDLLKMKLAHY